MHAEERIRLYCVLNIRPTSSEPSDSRTEIGVSERQFCRIWLGMKDIHYNACIIYCVGPTSASDTNNYEV
jgi:hypothetical protein